MPDSPNDGGAQPRKGGGLTGLFRRASTDAAPTSFDELRKSLSYRVLLIRKGALSPEDAHEVAADPAVFCALWITDRKVLLDAFADRAETLYAQMSSEQALGPLRRRVLVAPEALSVGDLAALEQDDIALMAAVLSKNQRVFALFGEAYFLPAPLVEYLMTQDLMVLRNVIGHGSPSSRFETYPQRAIGRLAVHRKNYRVLQGVTETHNIRRHAFFDVGCLFGLSMVSAQELGYTRTHGCELDAKVFGRAKWIAEWMRANRPGDFRYYDKDFTTLELPANEYTLVMINNVLEHTPALDETIAQLGRVLAHDGVAYVYQGNNRALQFVRSEPHYRLPMLTILSRDLVVDVLLRMKRINKPEDYVVTRWPGYDELNSMFAAHGMIATFHPDSLGYWSAAAPVMPAQVKALRESIWTEAKDKLYGTLTAAERDTVTEIGQAYFREVDAALAGDATEAKIRYLKSTWDITAKRKS